MRGRQEAAAHVVDVAVSAKVHFQALAGWRRGAAALVAGVLASLAMPPVFAWPVLLIALPVLSWLIEGAAEGHRPRLSGAAAGWWFGFGYHLAGLYWIGFAFLVEAERFAALMPLAVVAMPAGLALFHAAAGAGAAHAIRRGVGPVVALAVAIALAEWLRGHVLTGFPWNTLGYALTGPLVLMQWAGLIGIYGLTLAVLLLALAPARVLTGDGRGVIAGRGGVRVLSALSACAGPLAVAGLVGGAGLAMPVTEPVAGVQLRLVQPSIAQRDKWRAEKQREIFDTHLRLSRMAPRRGGEEGHAVARVEPRDANPAGPWPAGITHILWPEAAMPFRPLSSPIALGELAELVPDGGVLIAGLLRDGWVNAPGEVKPGAVKPDGVNPGGLGGAERGAWNSAAAFDGAAKVVGLYDKIHLVPFGEYLPLQETLEELGLESLTRQRGGFESGLAPRPLMQVPGLPPLAVLICYEAVFPGEVVQGGARPGALVNLTNDGWFGATSGPHQHFHQTRVRAVEQGLPILRVANNGITAIIDGRGRVLARLDLNQRGVVDGPLPGAEAPTIYSRIGDLPFWLAMLVVIVCGVSQRRARQL